MTKIKSVAAPQHWCRQWCRPSWSFRAKSPPGRRPRASWERDSSRMKGWIGGGNWKERCRETEPFGPDREEIGSVAKDHGESGELKCPKNEQRKTWQVQNVYSHTIHWEEQEGKGRIIYSIFNPGFILCHLHLHNVAKLLNWGHYLFRSRR